MEDSQVLDAESKAAPLQAPEAVIETSERVTPENKTPDKGMYSSAVTPIVAEPNHATEISTNINRPDYTYNSAIDKSKEPVVTTISTTKGNVTDNAYWQAHYGMDDTYKASDTEDYSWNRLAQERSQYTYEQEATQVLSDYAKSMQEIKDAASQAMDQYFGAAYGANQTADKMGWQGGQVTSNDAKTAFLKAGIATGMYNKFELQKYGVDSQLTVARLYAEANMEALALDMYQDAVNQAIREAELTGWYIAPEASEIMKQQKVARENLNNPNITDAERQRANKVISAGNAYFDKLGFQKDEYGHYIGVETLSNLEYQETVRANKENERLQAQANDIAQQAVNATYAQIESNERIANQQMAELRATTAATNLMTAYEHYGSVKVGGTSRPNFIQVNGTYEPLNVKTEKNGTIVGTYQGTKYNVYFDSGQNNWVLNGKAK